MSVSCSGCGSLLADDATVCDLCGTPIGGVEDASIQSLEEDQDWEEAPDTNFDEGPASGATASKGLDGIHCNQCGWKNPSDARFCSRCGSRLQQVSDGASPPGAKQSSRKAKQEPAVSRKPPSTARKESAPEATGGLEPGAGRRMGILIVAAVMVIMAVYLGFTFMGQNRDGSGLSAQGAPGAPSEPPLSAEFAAREAELRSELAALSGEARIDKQRELLTLYFTSGRFDLAGAQAEEIGRATGAESAWIDAGNFYYDWMESSAPENKAYYSRKATSAYQKALEINPDNLDIRTDMAVAYLYDPENSMLAIQETQAVLAVDSTHVQANFNRGIMLWQISRIDEAKAQFEKVLDLVEDPEDPLFQRAAEALATLNQAPAGS